MAKLKVLSNPPVFARRLRDARIKKELSQRQLGILAGIDESSASARVNQWERGKHLPEPKMIERIARVLGVPAPYFHAREDALAEWILAFPGVKPKLRRKKAERLVA